MGQGKPLKHMQCLMPMKTVLITIVPVAVQGLPTPEQPGGQNAAVLSFVGI